MAKVQTRVLRIAHGLSEVRVERSHHVAETGGDLQIQYLVVLPKGPST